MTQTQSGKADRCRQAFGRRFGQSCGYVTAKLRDDRTVRVHDSESGSWADYDISAWRVRRITESDPAAQ